MKLEGDRLKSIIDAIEPIKDPEIGISIVKLKMIESIEGEGKKIRVNVKLTVPGCPLSSTIEKDIKKVLNEKGYENVEVSFGFMSKKELDNIKEVIEGPEMSQSSIPVL